MKYSLALGAIALVGSAAGQAAVWGQCAGGDSYTGPKSCVAGAVCSTLNPYYGQCVPGAATTAAPKTTAAPAPAPTTAAASTTKSKKSKTTTTKSKKKSSTTKSKKASATTDAPVTTGKVSTGKAGTPYTVSGNIFAGRSQYVNDYYKSEVLSIAVPSLVAEGKASLTAAAKAAATVPSFVWFDTISKLDSLDGYLADIRAKNAAGAKIVANFVVYDLPDRDCAALASNGELSIANDGVNKYKTQYIDTWAATLKKYADVPVALVVEPDSLANMVTNLSVSKCANAQKAYEECVSYALTKLNLPNVSMYLDAGHAGWLGWPDNLKKAAPYFAGLVKGAGSPKAFRGFATNVANYNAWSISACQSYQSGASLCDEQSYINAFAPALKAAGLDAHFVVDQSRSGKQPTGQAQWGDWCNAIGTGFGIRPDTPSTNELLDAFVWVKPGGECDGTSDQSATRYDAHCGQADSLKPAPEAGTWFQAYFEQLLVNANPPFTK